MGNFDRVKTGVRRGFVKIQGTRRLDVAATRALTEKIKSATTLDPAGQKALAGLTQDQRKQYASVAAKLGGPERDLLERLLAGDKLTAGRDLALRGDLLRNLANLATQPLGPGVDRRQILAQAVRAVADPASITQGDALTCGAATVQIMLAKQNPAEYVRILAGLASAEGKVTLVNGNSVSRVPGWDKAAVPGAANQLMQTAFMAYAAGGYDAAGDTRADGKKGLYAKEAAFLQQGLLGKAVATLEGNSDEVMRQIALGANTGKPVSVLFAGPGGEGGHYVQVTSVKDGKLTYVDARDGKAHVVDAARFQESIRAANIETDGKAIARERPTDDSGILGGGFFKKLKKAVSGAVKSVGKAVSGAVKSVGKAVSGAVKSVGKAVSVAAKAVGKAAKAVGKFVKKNLTTILTVAQVVTMFVPGLQVVALGLAAYTAAKSGAAMVQGIKNGNWKQALAGGIGLVGSFAGGVGALGAKVVGQGAAAAAAVAGKVANVAGNVMVAADAIKQKNWGSLVGAVAGGVASGAGLVSAKAGAAAEKWASYAHKANGVYQGVTTKNYVQAAGSALSLGGSLGRDQLGLASGAAVLDKAGQAITLGGQVQQAAKKYGTAAVLGVLGGAAALGGARYLSMSPEERQKALQTLGQAGKDWGSGKFDAATKGGATVLGIDASGKTAGVLGKLGTLAGNALNLAEAYSRARNISEVAVKTGNFDIEAVKKNQGRVRTSVSGLVGLISGRKDNAKGSAKAAPPAPVTPGTARLDLTAGRPKS